MRTSVGRIGWLLALVMGLRVALSVVAGIKVEEAYYWNYSQHPSLSYFDHPPMVAWLIRAATWVGGDSPFWVHLPGVASFSLLTLTLIWLGNRMFDLRTGLLAGLLVNLLPVFAVISLVTVPDLPLLLAWAVGMACGWRLVSEGEPRWWLAVGVATGLGLDSKYPALLIPLGVMLYLGWRREWRLLFNGWMVASAGLACVLFAPVILWNMQHHWASLLFQGRGRFAESTSLGERLGGWLIQVAALSPAGFWLLFLSLALAWKERERPQVAYLLCWSLPFVLLMLVVSLKRGLNLNWPLPGYLAAILLAARGLMELHQSHPRRALRRVVAVTAFSLPLWGLLWLGVVVPMAWLNPVDDVNGWAPMANRMLAMRASMPQPQRTFLVGHGYQAASMVAFYTGESHLTLSNNILGESALGYDYFEPPDDFLGWDAVVMVYEMPTASGRFRPRVWLDESRLKQVFQRVEPGQWLQVDRAGRPLRRYCFYRCYGYLGPVEGS